MNLKPAQQSIRIMLLENHRLMAEGIQAILTQQADIFIEGVFGSGRNALEAIRKGVPVNLVISDLWLDDDLNGIQVLTQLQAASTPIPVLILSMDETPDSIRMALQAGAMGYLPKDCTSAELLKAIRRIVQETEKYLSPRLLSVLVSEKAGSLKSLPDDMPELTKQELRVLNLIASEYENQEIAELLFVSTGTVETHRKNLMKKLKVKNAIALANLANRYGLAGNPLPGQGEDNNG